MPKLLLATNNPGKIRELRQLLADCGWELVTPSELGLTLSDEEVGSTYEENAKMKALKAAQASGLHALADDSGLDVQALGGELGPRSARFGGEGAIYQQKMALLLERLQGVQPRPGRGCRFTCVIAIAEPQGGVYFGQGICLGVVAEVPRGEGGFGYDPIFYLPDMGRTMAELAAEEKNMISHRARAAQMARQTLKELLYDYERGLPTSQPAG
ncbi:MAG: RdgB/HAM1 family non-canonical purine NTP pyrophosphatase [Chloroflexota bacterium]|nr:RdgB/HAM1 family non-canonical purine NTP pyrophosphatase [Chloroflexota bacterium]